MLYLKYLVAMNFERMPKNSIAFYKIYLLPEDPIVTYNIHDQVYIRISKHAHASVRPCCSALSLSFSLSVSLSLSIYI